MAHAHAPLVVHTDRLVLRPFTLEDHLPYAAITSDPEVMRHVGVGQPHTPETAWRAIAGVLGHWQLLGYGLWAVALRDGPLIGHVGFIDVFGWPGFELGWLLGRAHWGRGYAQESAGAALRIAREVLHRERVISLIRPGNERSVRVAQALGAQREGTVELLGACADLYVHARPSS